MVDPLKSHIKAQGHVQGVPWSFIIAVLIIRLSLFPEILPGKINASMQKNLTNSEFYLR